MIRLKIGIDFDNTIASFNGVFHRYAVEEKLIPASTPAAKEAVRNEIRKKKGNEQWTRLQGIVYSRGMAEAVLTEGFEECVRFLRERGTQLFVISHKTAVAASDKRAELRAPAMKWLETQEFFDKKGLGFKKEDIFFEETRLEKVKRITSCGCTHFIDDLPEIFNETSFPRNVIPLLYGEKSWNQLQEYFTQIP